ncbi:MAG: DUF1565 domain-containing protein [Planctomycetes bacterium]|nr:DUF1565 domain-containing protein [Planctomycetota bacterium]
MNDRIRGLLAALALLCAAGGAQTYIDPVNGNDAPGGGGQTNPLRTLTYAISAVGPAGPATFRLRAGAYTDPAETFPIALPDSCVVEADPATTVRGMQSVQIAGPPTGAGHTPALVVGGRGNGPVAVTLRGLLIEGSAYIAVAVDAPQGTGTLDLRLEDCVCDHYRDLEAVIAGNTVATIAYDRCTLRGLDEQLRITARGTSVTTLLVDHGVLSGAWVGADLISLGGTIAANLRGVRLIDHGLYGIRMGTQNNGTVAVRAEHCLFRKSGTRTIGLPTNDLGGIVDNPTGLAGTRTVRVENSIFWGNVNDCPHYNAANYTFGNNIVQQANLVAAGGNRNVAPGFVDAQGNDYRLLPGSPAVDAGDPTATTLLADFEGNPRFQGNGPDLGPDEFWSLYLYASGVAHVGGPWPTWLVFRALGPPGTPFAGFTSFGNSGLPWAPGTLYLAQPIFGSMFVGTIGSNGLGQAAIQLPVAPFAIGYETWWQGGFAVPPYLGINGNRVLLRP